MFLFIVAVIFGLLGAGALLLAPAMHNTQEGDKATSFRVIGGVLIFLAFVVFAISGLKSVPTKNIGIPVSFGKVAGAPYGPGLHETWTPWLHLADVSTRVQTTTFEVHGHGEGGLDVRIGGQQTAKLDVTIQWQVRDNLAADNLFLNYGANGGDIMGDIQNAVVVRSLKQVANDVMGDYNPIQDVSKNATTSNSAFSTFGSRIAAGMVHDIGGQVHVLKVLLPLAHYDAATQARLNQIQQQYAKTAIASQQIVTNQKQALANSALSKSVATDPNVLIAQCLQIVQEAIASNYQGLPATFCSFGNSNASVVVGRK